MTTDDTQISRWLMAERIGRNLREQEWLRATAREVADCPLRRRVCRQLAERMRMRRTKWTPFDEKQKRERANR